MEKTTNKQSQQWGHFWTWFALAIPILFTIFAVYLSRHFSHRNAQKNFESEVNEISSLIETRVQDYEQVLRGAAGLFNSSQSVERTEWKDYIAILDISNHYPGMQGISFVRRLRNETEKNNFIRRTEDEGLKDVKIDPPGSREEYIVVDYIEPLTDQNRVALGYDMFTEPTRRDGMIRARDTGLPTLTKMLVLRQDRDLSNKAGVLIFFPIYTNYIPHGTVAERQANLKGFVVSGFHLSEMIDGIVIGRNSDINFSIFDESKDGALLYESSSNPTSDKKYFEKTNQIEVGGRKWVISFTAPSKFGLSEAEIFQSTLILIAGVTISLLLFGVVLAMASAQGRASELAKQMTKDLLQETKLHQDARREVERSEGFVRLILNHLPVALYCRDVNDNLKITYWNNLSTTFFGLSLQDVIGKNNVSSESEISGLLEAGDREVLQKGGGKIMIDQRLQSGDGKFLYLRTSKLLVAGKDENQQYLLSISDNITESAQEEKRRSVAHKITSLLSVATNIDETLKKILIMFCTELDWDFGSLWTVRDGILHCREVFAAPNRDLDDFRKVTRELTFAPGQGLPGRVLEAELALWIEDVRIDQNFLRRAEAIRNGLITGFAFPVILDREVLLVFDFFSRQTREKDDALLMMAEIMGSQVALFIKRKEAEENERIALSIKSDFISIVSHELRTPMTVIKESISIVYDETTGPINAEQKDFLETAKRNVERLSRLINNVLDYQKLESRSISFKFEMSSINETVKEVAQGFQMISNKGGPQIVLELEEDLPNIKFDRDKIIQVLTNLVNNAFNYAAGGKVYLCTQRHGLNSIRVAVRDEGKGIKKEDMVKLFERFSQVQDVNERKTGSSGLGLAISKMIINAHDGKIDVESEVGKGTTFYFILPIVERRESRNLSANKSYVL